MILLSTVRAFCRSSRSFGASPAFRRTTSLMMTTSSSSSTTTTTTTGLRSAIDERVSNSTERMKHEAEQYVHDLVSLFPKGEDSVTTVLATHEQCDDFRKFLDRDIDAVLFDCDGVLYRSPDPAPHAAECLRSLVRHGKRLFFVTNNAGYSRAQLREKLHSILQIDFLTEDMMVSASYSVAQYLKRTILHDPQQQHTHHGGRIHVIGSKGLCQELQETGFCITGGPNAEDKAAMSREELAEYDFSEEHPIDALVIGHDTEFNFRKMSIANVLLQWNPSAPLVSTNEDAFDLVGVDGRHIPGNGCVVRALEHSSGRRAVCTGKPNKILADLILQDHGIEPSRTLMVGDRLDTDIQWAVNSGMHSLLVMTGVTTPRKLQDLKGGTLEEPMPDWIAPTVGVFCQGGS